MKVGVETARYRGGGKVARVKCAEKAATKALVISANAEKEKLILKMSEKTMKERNRLPL